MSVPETDSAERQKFAGFFEQLPRIAGAATILIGAVMLLGWWVRMPGVPGIEVMPSMSPLTAAAFVLAGLSLFLSYPKYQWRWARELSRALAILVIGIAVITGGEFIFNRDVGLDLLLTPPGLKGSGAVPPSRIAINTAVAFLFVGLGIVLLPRDRRTNGLRSQITAFEVLIVAFIALVGYAFGVRDFYSMQPFLGMALISAMTFVILGLGLLFSQLHRGLPGLVVDAGAAGAVARRLLPATIILPFIF
jgi:hypothetical protein